VSKTGPRCTVCSSKHRHSIELGLVARVSAAALAQRYGASKHAILRHGHSHLSPTQRAALLSAQRPTDIDLDKLRVSESEGLLHQLVAQRARLQQHAELAGELGDVRGAISAEGAITANLSLVGKLLGQLATHHNVTHTSLLVQPDYLRLRQALITAVRPYPEAARAIAAALFALESDAAKVIEQATKPVLIDHTPTVPAPPC